MSEHKHNPIHDESSGPDGPLEALLDEALAPPKAPDGLEARLVGASVAASRAQHDAHGPMPLQEHAPVGRIGGGRWTRAAASLAMAAAIGLTIIGAWALFDSQAPTQPAPIDSVASPTQGSPDALTTLERELSELQLVSAGGFDPVDEQIELLALQLELTQAGPLWPTGEPLEEVTGEARAYQLLHEWDLAWVH